MNHKQKWVAVACLLSSSWVLAGDANSAGWFVRAGAGLSRTAVDLPREDALLDPDSTRFDRRDTEWSLDAGYRFANGLGVAAGYRDHGALGYYTPPRVPYCPPGRICSQQVIPAYEGEIGATDWRVGVDYRLRWAERWSLTLGLAAARAEAELAWAESAHPEEVFSVQTRHWRASPSVSLGYQLQQHWMLDARAERLADLGDAFASERFSVSSLTLGATYTF